MNQSGKTDRHGQTALHGAIGTWPDWCPRHAASRSRSELGPISARMALVAMRIMHVMRARVEMHGAHRRLRGPDPEKPAPPLQAVRPIVAA
jgi:hypothetical protein